MSQNTNKGDWDPELPAQMMVSEQLCAHLSITKGKKWLYKSKWLQLSTVTGALSPSNESKPLDSFFYKKTAHNRKALIPHAHLSLLDQDRKDGEN